MTEHFETRSKKGRGRAQRSLDLIDAMFDAAEAAQPITGRGIGYKLFAAGLIPSMERSEMQRVYRLLKEAREEGIIPWAPRHPGAPMYAQIPAEKVYGRRYRKSPRVGYGAPIAKTWAPYSRKAVGE